MKIVFLLCEGKHMVKPSSISPTPTLKENFDKIVSPNKIEKNILRRKHVVW